MNFLIENDIGIIWTILLLAFVFGSYLMKDIVAGLGFTLVIFLIGVMIACLFNLIIISNDWNNETIVKIIPVEELTLIKLPNNILEIWYIKSKITFLNLNKTEDYLNQDKIDRVEFRTRKMFGPDSDNNKVFFKK